MSLEARLRAIEREAAKESPADRTDARERTAAKVRLVTEHLAYSDLITEWQLSVCDPPLGDALAFSESNIAEIDRCVERLHALIGDPAVTVDDDEFERLLARLGRIIRVAKAREDRPEDDE